jgi:hypothetical protein
MTRHSSTSRRSKALPPMPYQYAEWKKCRIAPDYHVEIAGHYYSVPSRLIHEELEARITDRNDVRPLTHPRANNQPKKSPRDDSAPIRDRELRAVNWFKCERAIIASSSLIQFFAARIDLADKGQIFSDRTGGAWLK